MVQNLFRWIPLKWNRYDFYFVPLILKCLAQSFCVDFGSPADEGHVSSGDQNTHLRVIENLIGRILRSCICDWTRFRSDDAIVHRAIEVLVETTCNLGITSDRHFV